MSDFLDGICVFSNLVEKSCFLGGWVGGVCVCARVCACMLSSSVVSDSLRPFWTVAHQASLSWDFSGKNTGVGCHSLYQRIFLTQGWNLRFLAGRFFVAEPLGKPLFFVVCSVKNLS